MRLASAILCALALVPALAPAQDKPLVAESHVVKTLPANTTLQLDPAVASAASVNVPCTAGAAPASPHDGDIWCTTAGLFVRVGSTTVGPLGSGGGSLSTTGAPAAGQLAQFSGPTAITNGDLTGDVTTSGSLATTLAASGVAAGTYGSSTQVAEVSVDAKGRVTAAANVAITGSGAVANITFAPQGRLTLVSATPVMTADEVAKSTIFYDCYVGSSVPYYDGANDRVDTIASCEVSTALESSGAGLETAAAVFDLWWDHNAGPRLCVATNGSGGGWASDAGGANTARGTGYSQVHNVRGYWTNANTLTHCYNAATDEGPISPDQATYLGTFYTTAAGQTGIAMNPAAVSGGSNTIVGLWNGYNRVRITATSRDGHSSNWTYASATWAALDGSTSNRVSWVDGLRQSSVLTSTGIMAGASSVNTGIGLCLDSTTCTPAQVALNYNTSFSYLVATDAEPAQVGFHYEQVMQVTNGSTGDFWSSQTGPTAQQQYEALTLEQ